MVIEFVNKVHMSNEQLLYLQFNLVFLKTIKNFLNVMLYCVRKMI